MNYEIDLKNSFIDYITQTKKKYFKYALDYAIKNNMDCVKVNRIYFIFNFEELWVKIGSKGNLTKYKLKERINYECKCKGFLRVFL